MTTHVSTTEMSHEEWLERRKDTIGSSDVGTILGLNKFATARDLFDEKTGLKPPFEGNKHTRWGLLFEDSIAKAFTEDELPKLPEGSFVQRDNKIRVHPDLPWATCNIDRMIFGGPEPIIMEMKSTTSFAMKQWEAAVPLSYYAQVQWQMFVSGYRKAIIWLAVFDQKEFQALYVERNDEFIQKMGEAAIHFRHAVANNDNSTIELTMRDIERMKPVEGSQIEATPEIAEALAKLVVVKAQKSEVEKSEKAIAATIKEFVGVAENLVVSDEFGVRVLATYKLQHKDAYVSPAVDYRVLNIQREKKSKKEVKG